MNFALASGKGTGVALFFAMLLLDQTQYHVHSTHALVQSQHRKKTKL